MTFEFENIGPIKKASLEMGKLTVVCGKNNTGKTYLTYAVWHCLNDYIIATLFSIPEEQQKIITESLKKNKKASIDLSIIEGFINEYQNNTSKNLVEELPDTFNANKEEFKEAKIKFDFHFFKYLL